MSLTSNLGNERHASAWFITSDGHVIPFHAVILDFRSLLPCVLDDLVNSRVDAGQPRIPVPFDSQTVWRVFNFIYHEDYDDLDVPLTFPVVDPPRASPSASTRLIDISSSDEETELSLGFRNLQVTPRACTSAVLLKAWANLLVYRVASIWTIDRLVVESSTRFDRFLSGASGETDFPEFVDAVFNSVSDPAQILYDRVAEECVDNAEELCRSDHFLAVVQRHGLLGRLLFVKITSRSRGQSNASAFFTTPAPTVSAASTAASPSVIEDLQDQLAVAQNDVLARDTLLEAREAEVQRLKQNIESQHATLTRQSIKITALEGRTVAPGPEDPKLTAQLKAKEAALENLQDKLDSQDLQIVDLEAKLKDSIRRTTELTHGINHQRSNQPHNTNLMIQRNEARQKFDIVQQELTTSERKVKDLEARLAAKEQELVTLRAAPAQPTPRVVAQADAPALPAPSVGPTRKVAGFGALTKSVNSINAGTAVAPVPRLPLALPSLPPGISTETTGGALTFIQRMAARRQAAGIGGGELEATILAGAPASMPVNVRSDPTAPEQSSPTLSGAPSTNGVAAVVPAPTNDAPRGPHSDIVARRTTGPHAGSHARPQTPQSNGVIPSAAGPDIATSIAVNGATTSTVVNGASSSPISTTQASTVGQSNAVLEEKIRIIDQQRIEIARLQNQGRFYQKQLNDARNGPASNVNTRGHGGSGFSSPGEDTRRLKIVLTALKEYDLEHKACLDCSINFNSEWRGIVDDVSNPELILNCKKCVRTTPQHTHDPLRGRQRFKLRWEYPEIFQLQKAT
ncbi:hypothetical protein D6C84_08471 [Aureobasidium pullulans]|uniref:Uncharacterized protein n=1 Tax=Aureobasidium pullulans TaxID=5580 RepID=A0A4S9XGC7_AURPU|nr:hypothetical protein D6C84_08471 [Aureobasidium pullulans]